MINGCAVLILNITLKKDVGSLKIVPLPEYKINVQIYLMFDNDNTLYFFQWFLASKFKIIFNFSNAYILFTIWSLLNYGIGLSNVSSTKIFGDTDSHFVRKTGVDNFLKKWMY